MPLSKVHKNALIPHNKLKKISGEGHSSLPKPHPTGDGTPPPQTPTLGAYGASIPRLRRLGAIPPPTVGL